MTRILVLFLILVEALVVVAKANNVESLATPTPSMPSNNVKQDVAEAPQNQIRRLGNHQLKVTRFSAAPCLNPSEAPSAKDDMHYSEGGSSLNQESTTTQLQDIKIKKEHHHSLDKSVAGAGVILVGLATAFFVAIICYIRATRRKNREPTSPASPSSKV